MTQGRKPLKSADITDVIDPSLDQDKINGAMTTMRSDATELAMVAAQHDSAVRAVAAQMGYQLPADCTDPDLIQRDISANMRRSVEACLEVGRGLMVLKSACEHGEFSSRLDVLGIDPSVARRFMQSAAKFTNRATSHVLKAVGGQGKLFEMLVLDDDQIEELELTGQTGELKLDDVATMSVKELRAALREAKQEAIAKDQVLADKNASMDKLRAQVKRVQAAAPDEVLADLCRETTGFFNEAMGTVQGRLRQGFVALVDHHAIHGGDSQQVMAGYLGQLQTLIHQLREEFMLPNPVGDGTPEWQRWADAQDAAAGTGADH